MNINYEFKFEPEFNNQKEKIIKQLNEWDNFSDNELKYILNKISNNVRQINDSCMSNFRLAIKNHYSEIKYNSIKNKGCCGFSDIEIELNSGQIILFGFNYGH